MRYYAQMQAVIELLSEMSNSDAPADVLATKYFRGRRYIGSGDRRVISNLTFAILRHREKLNWWAEHVGLAQSHRPRAWVLIAMCLLEDQQDQVADVFSGHEYGPRPLTPLEEKALDLLEGQSLDHPEMPEYVRLDLPEWSYLKLKAIFGDQLGAEIEALNGQAPLDIRVNTLLTSRAEVARKLSKSGWEVEETPYSPLGLRIERGKPLSSHELFKNGFVEVQDEGSQLVALLCDAKPGQAVLDFCAGAGGKSLALAAYMENKGRLFLTDVVEHRLTKAKLRMRRAGVNNHELKLLDESNYHWLRRQEKRFDRVLVDAPCSGSGTWRRNPDLKFRFEEKDLSELIAKQTEILEKAAPLIKPGGYLVYATCSLYRDENEDQMEAFLKTHEEFELVRVKEVWSSCPVTTPYLRLTPHQNKTDGFFTAVLKRSK